jgi:hypothetical protein
MAEVSRTRRGELVRGIFHILGFQEQSPENLR